VDTKVLKVDAGRRQLIDLTDEVRKFCSGKPDGLVNVFAPHATAGLALMELGSGSEGDLFELLDRIMPRDNRYAHRHGSAGHGADHLLPAIVSPSLNLPVVNGQPALGTWQSIVFVDLNRDNPSRQVRMSFLGA
jgi:secondary thiamine-phosphate synthase enzyme